MSTFTAAHRSYVMSLYKRTLKNSLDWTVRRDLWRAEAMMIRAEFERNRDVHDPRALAVILEKAEANLAKKKHPDPVISPLYPGGTKWERNTPVRVLHPFPIKHNSCIHRNSLQWVHSTTTFPHQRTERPYPLFTRECLVENRDWSTGRHFLFFATCIITNADISTVYLGVGSDFGN
ncbi:hypothetical protein EYR36_006708 [Pleurotus pulmonarius]|nr:hypothetical protein EYR36_006708 [Pleurotus pulmonarius]